MLSFDKDELSYSRVEEDRGERIYGLSVARPMAIFALAVIAIIAFVTPTYAYVGPGAGFALVSSFLTLVIAFFTAFFALFTLPARMLVRRLRQKPAHALNENIFDQQYFEKQRDVIEEAYKAVRTLREFLESHPSVMAADIQVPAWIQEGRIWVI